MAQTWLGWVGPQPGPVDDRGPHPGALLGLLQDAKSLVTAETLDALVVHAVALPAKNRGHAAIAVAGMGPGQVTEPSPQVLFFGPRDRCWPALGGARLADGPTRPTLRDRELVQEHRHRLAAACRAQKFPLATSFSISMSRTWSATMRLSPPFSRSSSFRRLASSAFMPPYWFLQR